LLHSLCDRGPVTGLPHRRPDDEPADMFGDLGDYGVSEDSESVHPVGNPISHSTHIGFNIPVVCVS
jgi:hypothetical protein